LGLVLTALLVFIHGFVPQAIAAESVDLRVFGNGSYNSHAGFPNIDPNLLRLGELLSPDINLMHLPLDSKRRSRSQMARGMSICNFPEELPRGFTRAGFNILAVHGGRSAEFCTPEALDEQRKKLRSGQSMFVGIGGPRYDANWNPPVMRVKGVRVAVAALPRGEFHMANSAATIEQTLAKLKARVADVRVLTIDAPTLQQAKDLARRFIADFAGDVAIVNHRDAPAGFEMYNTPQGRKAVLIAGLADFYNEKSREPSAVLKLQITKQGVQGAEVLAARQTFGKPGPGSPEDGQKIVSGIKSGNRVLAMDLLPQSLQRSLLLFTPKDIPVPGATVEVLQRAAH
jgi:hypothetical protein